MSNYKWERREKKLKSKKSKMIKHGKGLGQRYSDMLGKRIKELEKKSWTTQEEIDEAYNKAKMAGKVFSIRSGSLWPIPLKEKLERNIKEAEEIAGRKVKKEIDEFAVVASQQKLPKYGYGRPSTENTSSFVPEMKEFSLLKQLIRKYTYGENPSEDELYEGTKPVILNAPRKFYHLTRAENVKGILNEGLKLNKIQGFSTSTKEKPIGIYLGRDELDSSVNLEMLPKREQTGKWSLLEVNLPKGHKLHRDKFGFIVSKDDIPSQHIKVSEAFQKEFGTISSGGFSPTYNYSNKKKKILESISKLHESNIDEIEDEAEEKKPQTKLQEKILGGVENFEEKLVKSFIDEYEKLAILSKEYSDEELKNLFFLAKSVNQLKEFNFSAPKEINRLEQVIYIDSIAHNLHKQKYPDGSSLYKQLDELADISKSIGEIERVDRLLILQSVQNARKIEDYMHVDVLQKGSLLEKSKSLWRLLEKCIKIGVEKLSNRELILLREWIYSKI